MKTNKTQEPNATAGRDAKEQRLLFPELTLKPVVVDFQAPHISSDGGGLLLGRLDRSYGYLKRFATCFTDYRDAELTEHSLLELVRQRVYGLGLGYEDLNDHDELCKDPLMASVCGKADPQGQKRLRPQDQGKGLAGKSTLNRLELTPGEASAQARYKKIVANMEGLEDYFIAEYVRSVGKESSEVILDLDRTNDPLHGEQEGRFFHGYYGEYCYTPLYIFAGDWPVAAALHTAEEQHLEETLKLLAKIVSKLREKLPKLRIIVRADSGFCRDELMSWCEDNRVDYVFGLQRNKLLEFILRGTLRSAKGMLDYNKSQSERLYKDFRYRAKTWAWRKRRVVGKAEWTQQGSNPRFIITNLPAESFEAKALYEKVYCARGDMENRIKEQQLDLYADRTSTATLRANQLRLWFSTLGYLLVNQLRRVALAGTELARATCGTIRRKLFKVGAVVRISARRVWVSLSEAYPWKMLFRLVARVLAAPG